MIRFSCSRRDGRTATISGAITGITMKMPSVYVLSLVARCCCAVINPTHYKESGTPDTIYLNMSFAGARSGLNGSHCMHTHQANNRAGAPHCVFFPRREAVTEHHYSENPDDARWGRGVDSWRRRELEAGTLAYEGAPFARTVRRLR